MTRANAARTVVALVLPFLVSAAVLLPLFVIKPSVNATIEGTSNTFGFVVGNLPDQRVGVLLPAGRSSELMVSNVLSGKLPLGQNKSGARLTPVISSEGRCSFSISNARIFSARPLAGDRVTLSWKATDPDRISVHVQPSGKLGSVQEPDEPASRLVSIEAAGVVSNVSGCGNGTQLEGKQVADVVFDVECASDWSYSFRGTGKILPEPKIPVAEGTAIEVVERDGTEVLPGLQPGGHVTFDRLKPIALSGSDYLLIQQAHSALIDLNFHEGFQFSIGGTFGVLQSGRRLDQLSDLRPTLLHDLIGDQDLEKYIGVVVALGAAVISVLTRLKVVPSE